MHLRALITISGLLVLASYTHAQDETFTSLRVGSVVYSNVTVITATTTHLTFMHYLGVTSAKLEELEPAMQAHFHFDHQAAATLLAQQKRGDMLYRQAVRSATNSPSGPQQLTNDLPLLAKSFLNQPAPELYVEKWLSEAPDTKGKFVLVDFWATWCPPCRKSIPELNAFSRKFADKLVVIGVSDETEEKVMDLKDPKLEYASAIDTKGRMKKELAVSGIPHVILIDPKGIVRWEGFPLLTGEELTEKVVADVIAKYPN